MLAHKLLPSAEASLERQTHRRPSSEVEPNKSPAQIVEQE